MNIVREIKTKRLEQVECKIKATFLRTLLGFVPNGNRSLVIGVNRSKLEAAPLLPTRVKVLKDWSCPFSAQGTSSYLHTKHLQHIYTG